MTIEQIKNGEALTLELNGRLDTVTAPMLEGVIEEHSDGLQQLLLDCSGLEYISSAGLRVLLKAQKQMNTHGCMKLTNVNENIMEVFDITGFADILTIE